MTADQALHELVAGLVCRMGLSHRVVWTAACAEDLRLALDLLQVGVLLTSQRGS